MSNSELDTKWYLKEPFGRVGFPTNKELEDPRYWFSKRDGITKKKPRMCISKKKKMRLQYKLFKDFIALVRNKGKYI